MTVIVDIQNLRKSYADGFEALKGVTLQINKGEIFALLGPNGAGKTTLISVICGISNLTSGTVTVDGFDIIRDFRAARSIIGLVPQDVTLEPFGRVKNTVRFSRGLFGQTANEAHVEIILRKLSLWDKRDNQCNQLSGGMKRRTLIAKALSHEPKVLFLDEPTAGVDVELRRDMWQTVAELKATGVTIILTTHYIEEAEAMADRVGVIAQGKMLLVEEKHKLMQQLGQKQVEIQLDQQITRIPDGLSDYSLELGMDGYTLVYTYDSRGHRTGITKLLNDVASSGLVLRDLKTRQSSLEDIFVGLVEKAEQRGNV
ncbi:MAG: ABC transporter ATP-binding protein [Aestuariivita sp.]|nr:ABC transporter ATP-binding protein [Aestuariivita sp.]